MFNQNIKYVAESLINMLSFLRGFPNKIRISEKSAYYSTILCNKYHICIAGGDTECSSARKK